MPRFIREPHEAYHAQRDRYLTSHQLIEFRHCPKLYRKKQSGLIHGTYDSESLFLGRAAHVLTLEGRERFNAEFIVDDGPINPKTEKAYGHDTKKFHEWSRKQTRPVLTNSQYALLCELDWSVHHHDEAKALLCEGIAEGVLRCIDAPLPRQVRCDWFNPDAGLIDLKTCDDLDRFTDDCVTFSYVAQMAFYRDLIRKNTGQTVPVHLIAVEKREPYRCGVWEVYPASLDEEQRLNDLATAQLAACKASGEWPTGYEAKRILY